MARPKGKTLALEDVLAAGHQVVERDGPLGLTLTSVARALDIKPPSLCHHVATNEALRWCVVEHSWSRLAQRLADIQVADPRQRLQAIATATRGFALEHPHSFELMVHTRLPHARVAGSPVDSQLLVPLLTTFRELGLPKAQRVHAARAFRSALTGFLLLEIAGQFQLEASPDQSFAYLVQLLISGFA
jgi:AcrR family transcriptional regulator